MRDVLIDVLVGLGILAVLLMPVWVPRYHRWVDARRERDVTERRSSFHSVHFPAEDEKHHSEASHRDS